MASQLVKVSYGEMMLHLIGFMYEKQAMEFMTDPVAGMGTWADLGFRRVPSILFTLKTRFPRSTTYVFDRGKNNACYVFVVVNDKQHGREEFRLNAYVV